MSVEEQLRAYGRTIEQRRVPIVAQEVLNAEIVMLDHTGGGEPRRPRRRWILSAAAVTVLVATVGLLTFDGGDSEPSDTPIDSPPTNPTNPPTTAPVTTPATTTATETEPSTTAPATTPTTTPTTTTPVLSDLLGDDAAAIGETVTFDDGAVARVNSVVVDAPPRNTLYVLDDDPESLTELEIERCLGDDAATDIDQTDDVDDAVYAAGQNFSRYLLAGQWIAMFDDGTTVPARPAYHPNLAFDPGGCVRAYVVVPTPDDARVVGVILFPWRCCWGTWVDEYWDQFQISCCSGYWGGDVEAPRDFEEFVLTGVGWDFTRSRPIDGPLRPSEPARTVGIGEPMPTFTSVNATVLEVIDDADPLPSSLDLLPGDLQSGLPPQPGPGHKLVEVRAEICADPDWLDNTVVSELGWLIVTDDNGVGTAVPESFNGSDGALLWDDKETFLDPPVYRTSRLVFEGSDEPDRTDESPALSAHPRLAPGECISGYVQIELPDDAIPVDVIVAYAFDSEYSEVGRTRVTDPS